MRTKNEDCKEFVKNAEPVTLEINAVIPDAKTVQDMAVTFQFAEILEFAFNDMLRQTPKITEDLQLQFLWHPRQLGGARRRENDLKHTHKSQ